MIMDENENQPCLCSKSQTLFTEQLHGRGMWSKHMIHAMRQFLALGSFYNSGIGKGLESLSKL